MSFDQVVVFSIVNGEYAVPVDLVVSIEKVQDITPIPHLPKYLLGYTKNRGEVIPVIDFQQVLQGSYASGEQTRMVVLKTDMLTIGLVVDDAKEILNIPSEALNQVGLINYSKTKYFIAIANLENRMVTCVDPQILLQSLEGIRDIVQYMGELERN